METFDDVTNVELGDEIVTWAGRVAAGEAHLLALIGEFDRREAWTGPGLLSCAHWLTWRIGIGLGAARERVRVASRLRDLPDIAAAFSAGRMSWSQVRAVTRVAGTDDGVDWVGLARHASGAQLERIVRGMRRAHSIAEAEADPERHAYQMRTKTHYDADGTMVITIRASAEDGAVIQAGLEAMRHDLDRQRQPAAVTPSAPVDVPAGTSTLDEPKPATDSEALLAMARLTLDRQRAEHPDVARRTRSRLTVQIDPLSGWGRLHDGEIVPPASLASIAHTLPGPGRIRRLRPLRDSDLTRHDLGTTTREPSLALRELVGCIDGERCRFPGCTRRRKLHAHHVIYWSHGGPTDLSNLVLLCSRHHTVVHDQGFQLVLRPDRRLDVTTPEGTPLLHHPGLPLGDREDLDADARLDVQASTPRMDLGYVVNVLLHQAA